MEISHMKFDTKIGLIVLLLVYFGDVVFFCDSMSEGHSRMANWIVNDLQIKVDIEMIAM